MTKSLFVIDARGKPIGRISSQAAFMLQGKHLPNYRPNYASSIIVKIVNLKQCVFTGSKLDLNKIHRSSGYPGGLKSVTLRQAFNKSPRVVFRNIITNMLPNNRLRKI